MLYLPIIGPRATSDSVRRALQTNEKSFICLPTEQGMRLVRPCQHDEELLAIQTFVLQRVMSILCRIGCDQGSWLRSALLEEFLLFRLVLRPASKGPEAHEGVRENRATGHSHKF